MMIQSKRLLTVKETANELRTSAATIYALVAAKKIRHERIGMRKGAIRIPSDALDEYRQSVTVQVEVLEVRSAGRPSIPVSIKPGIELW